MAELEGIEQSYITKRMAGLRGNAVSDAQHGRFAAAVLLDRLIADANAIHGLELDWGQPNSLTKAGGLEGSLRGRQGGRKSMAGQWIDSKLATTAHVYTSSHFRRSYNAGLML